MVVYLFEEKKGCIVVKKEKKLMKKLSKIFGGILFGSIGLIISYSLFMYILGFDINILSGTIIVGAVISIFSVLSKLPECIKKEIVYEVNGHEFSDNSEYMRGQLHVVKGNDKVESNVKSFGDSKYSYSYVFDNEYRDDTSYDDIIIDDISGLFVEKDYECLGNNGYSRCKNKYRGRYLR